MKLILNLSMLGDRPTGLGVYSLLCAKVATLFNASVIGRVPFGIPVASSIESPASISLGGGRLAAIRRQLWTRKLNFDGNHLVYSPTHHGLPRQHGQVITIHDLICLRFPRQHITQYVFFKFFMPRLLKRCRAVFTVSEASRCDIADTYQYPLERIYVVPNAVDAARFVPSAIEVDVPYLLMVGARYSHKNVDEVLRRSHLWKDNYRLIVTSCSGKYRAALERLVDDLGVRDRVEFHDYVSGHDLLRLYQGCSALVYPSKWEGFGIPPLEALACGRPVIASDISIHREVLADSAFFVELGNELSWNRAFIDLQDPEKLSSKLAAGRRRVERYSQECALQTLEASLLDVEPRILRRSGKA